MNPDRIVLSTIRIIIVIFGMMAWRNGIFIVFLLSSYLFLIFRNLGIFIRICAHHHRSYK